MKYTILPILAVVFLGIAVLLTSCNGSKTTKISDILGNTDRYINRDVTVAGKVVKTYEVNLFIADAGLYQVDDGTGKIWVITKNGVPEEGQLVGLKANVSSGLKIAGEKFGAVLHEKERRIK